MQVYKQKVKHLLYEHQNNISTLKADGELGLKLAGEEAAKREAELQKDCRNLNLQLKEQVPSMSLLLHVHQLDHHHLELSISPPSEMNFPGQSLSSSNYRAECFQCPVDCKQGWAMLEPPLLSHACWHSTTTTSRVHPTTPCRPIIVGRSVVSDAMTTLLCLVSTYATHTQKRTMETDDEGCVGSVETTWRLENSHMR